MNVIEIETNLPDNQPSYKDELKSKSNCTISCLLVIVKSKKLCKPLHKNHVSWLKKMIFKARLSATYFLYVKTVIFHYTYMCNTDILRLYM